MANQNLQQPSSSWPNTRTPEAPTSVIERTEKAAEQVTGSAIEQVRSVRTGISEQRDQIVERIRRVGTAMRESGDRVRKEDEMAADYLRMASERIDRVASYVTTADLSTMATDTQEFIRKRPAVFFGGAFLLGLAAGRFLKASGGPATGPSSASAAMGSYGSSSSAGKRLPSEGTPTPTTPSSIARPATAVGAVSPPTPAPNADWWSAPAQSPNPPPAKPSVGSDIGNHPNPGTKSRLP